MKPARHSTAFLAIASALASAITTTTAVAAATPEIMMQQCRIRAHEIMQVRLPDVETKYEGQRTDGTHAVNGTAWLRGRLETFQCSFDRSGRDIVNFVVNQPSEGPRADTAPERGEPVTREERVRFRDDNSQEFSDKLNSGDSVKYVFRGGNRKFLHVNLATRSHRIYFNIFTPDGQTLYESARAGNDYRGQLWLDGEHIVEVYNIGSRSDPFSVLLELQPR